MTNPQGTTTVNNDDGYTDIPGLEDTAATTFDFSTMMAGTEERSIIGEFTTTQIGDDVNLDAFFNTHATSNPPVQKEEADNEDDEEEDEDEDEDEDDEDAGSTQEGSDGSHQLVDNNGDSAQETEGGRTSTGQSVLVPQTSQAPYSSTPASLENKHDTSDLLIDSNDDDDEFPELKDIYQFSPTTVEIEATFQVQADNIIDDDDEKEIIIPTVKKEPRGRPPKRALDETAAQPTVVTPDVTHEYQATQYPVLNLRTTRSSTKRLHLAETEIESEKEKEEKAYVTLMQDYRQALLQPNISKIVNNNAGIALFNQVNLIVEAMVEIDRLPENNNDPKILPHTQIKYQAENKTLLQLLVLSEYGHFAQPLQRAIAWALSVPENILQNRLNKAKQQAQGAHLFMQKAVKTTQATATEQLAPLDAQRAELSQDFPPAGARDQFIAQNQLFDDLELRSCRKK